MSAAGIALIRSPHWSLLYQGVDISADISPMVLSVAYTDYLSGLSGEMEVVIEDHDRKWQSAWYPGLGDQVSLAIGYRGEELLVCGDFQIDQLELAGPPDTFRVRCLAAFITPSIRTCNSAGFENQTLLGIAGAIAEKYGFQIVSAPNIIDVAFERVTQKYETDLAFLKRLAKAHDYDFTIRGLTLVFYSRNTLEALPPVVSISRSDLLSFGFRNETTETYKASQTSYNDLQTKALINQTSQASSPIATGDLLKIVSRCENGQQALLKAQAALHAHNSRSVVADLVMPGSVAIASGITVELSGFGTFDGVYIVLIARHRIDRSHGYTTRLEVNRVV